MATETVRYCLCGGTMRGRSNPTVAAFLAETFDRVHNGDGHGPATRAQAAAARRREEAEASRGDD